MKPDFDWALGFLGARELLFRVSDAERFEFIVRAAPFFLLSSFICPVITDIERGDGLYKMDLNGRRFALVKI